MRRRGISLAWIAAGAALCLAGLARRADAAVLITADGVNCTLANAILTANSDKNTGGCVRVGASSIDDVIDLQYDVTISARDPTAGDEEDQEYGANGLPAITCHITLNAHGHTIQRDPALFAPPAGDGVDPCSAGERFRIFMVDYPGGNLDVNDAVLKNGCAGDGYGGGAVFFLGHTLNLTRVVVAGNRAGMGGAVFQHESTLSIIDSTLSGNTAFVGGVVFARTGTAKISNSFLLSNSAVPGSGNVCVNNEGDISCLPKGSGGAIAMKAGTLTVLGATISGGAAASGGALYNAGATMTLTGATLFQNSAVNGGVLSNAGGTGILTNVTAYQNSASGQGAVVYNSGGLARTVHATLVENSAPSGGGVFVATKSKSVTLTDTLLRNPSGGNCGLGPVGAGVVSGGHNFSTDATCALAGAGDFQNVPDLKLGAYVDDGTPADGRLPLLPGSPAIDAAAVDGTTSDQIGEQRMGNPDGGAVEYPRSVRVWIGIKNAADFGLRLDLLAEVRVNGALAGQGQLSNVTTGRAGFTGATFYTVPIPAVDAPSGSTLAVTVSARRTCSASGINAGTARLWYNGQPVDKATGGDAGSRAGLTAAGVTEYLFLRDGFALNAVAGSGGASDLAADAAVNSAVACTGAGRPFTPFGTWSASIQ